MTTREELLNSTFYNHKKPLVICDTECYPNFWSIGFLRVSDHKVLTFEHSHRSKLDINRILNIMLTHTVITFNGMNYDYPMIALALDGATPARLKEANDRIILGGLKYWETERALGVTIPRSWTHIDLIEPQPNAWASLKTLQGRLHGRKMQDLPYSPDTPLTEEEMDKTLAYMGNDLEATFNLLLSLKEPLELRAGLGQEYGTNFLSKSDSQIGEGIIRKRVEDITGNRIERIRTPGGATFPFRVPEYLTFDDPQLQEIVEKLRNTQFVVQSNGKVELPEWLEGKQVTIGDTTYAMGVGGLHSTESNRAIHSDDDYQLVDFDVASYYPNIILGSGLYPIAIGKVFLDVYRKIVGERVAAKHRAANKELEEAVRLIAKIAAEGLKISANGVFGKFGSVYSILYAPHLLIATTLTGQLALLMLISWAEKLGIKVVSANTDGVVLRVPRHMMTTIEKTRPMGGELKDLIERWESATGFVMEGTPYRSIYNASVNSYVAIKEDGKAKIKGPMSNPWREGDTRGMLMKNPQMCIVSNAVVDLLTKGIPIEDTINNATDVRDFVTVVNVKGGGVWGEVSVETQMMHEEWGEKVYPVDVVTNIDRAQYLGKVVRYYWAKDGAPIFYKSPDPRTGNYKKVSKTDGCRPLMELPEDYSIPGDIDREQYISAVKEALMDLGAVERPSLVRPLRIYKWSALGWFAVAGAA